MVIVGGYDSKLHVYTTRRGKTDSHPSEALTYHFSMLGHLNSIKDIAISPILGGKEDNLTMPDASIYIASAS